MLFIPVQADGSLPFNRGYDAFISVKCSFYDLPP